MQTSSVRAQGAHPRAAHCCRRVILQCGMSWLTSHAAGASRSVADASTSPESPSAYTAISPQGLCGLGNCPICNW